MSSDDDVVIVAETFNNKRARLSEPAFPAAFNSCNGTPPAPAVTANAAGAAAVTGTGDFAIENLQCPICIDLLYDPCVVPCGHEFCLTCIEEVVRSTRHSGCPVCRTNFTAARLGVNRKLKTMIEVLYAKDSSRRAREVAEDQERIRKEKAARDTREAASSHASLAARVEAMAMARGSRNSTYERLTHMIDALHGEAIQGSRAQRWEAGRRGMEAMLRSRRFRAPDRPGDAGGGAAARRPGEPIPPIPPIPAIPLIPPLTSYADARTALADRIAETITMQEQVRQSSVAGMQQQMRDHMDRVRQLSRQAAQLTAQLNEQPAAATEQPTGARPEQPAAAAMEGQPPSRLLRLASFSRPPSAAAAPGAVPEQPHPQPQAAERLRGRSATGRIVHPPRQGVPQPELDELPSFRWDADPAWMPRTNLARRTAPRERLAEGLFADSGGPADALAAEPTGLAFSVEEQEVMSARAAGDRAGVGLAAAASSGGQGTDNARRGGGRAQNAGAGTAGPASRAGALDDDGMPMPGYGRDDFDIPTWLEPPPLPPVARVHAFSEHMAHGPFPSAYLRGNIESRRLEAHPRSRDRPASVPSRGHTSRGAVQHADEQRATAPFPRRARSSRPVGGPGPGGAVTELGREEAMRAAAEAELDSSPVLTSDPGSGALAEGLGEAPRAAAGVPEAAAWPEAEDWLAEPPGLAVWQERAQQERASLVELDRVQELQQLALQRAQHIIDLESAGEQLRERLERQQQRSRQQLEQQEEQLIAQHRVLLARYDAAP